MSAKSPYLIAATKGVASDDSPHPTQRREERLPRRELFTSGKSSPKTRFSALKSSDPASPAAAELSDRIRQMKEQAIERDREATIQGQSLATLTKLIEDFMSPSRTISDEPFSPPQPQTTGTKASEIVAESFITTPESTKYHMSLLTSYRLKDLDPQALHKLPNGSLIKSTGDIIAHLRKEEETVITQFSSWMRWSI